MSAYYQQGLYAGECIGQFMGQSEGGKKTPYFGLKFMITARIEDDLEHAVQHSERTVYLYLSDKAIDMAIDAVTHLGYDRESLRFLDPSKDGFFNFAGKKCDLWCKVEDYNGDTKEKWSISLPRTPKEVVPIEDKELRRLDALFGKALKSRVPTKPVQAAKAPAKEFVPPAPQDSDTPF